MILKDYPIDFPIFLLFSILPEIGLPVSHPDGDKKFEGGVGVLRCCEDGLSS